ncbi:hypothetical protein HanHA300_Chr03g0090561 [Helianthus annuus]|nr:hypothetical protein HanHA300_Chr03g0090561 [Helianthus annuus]KAJ0767936.1 hypothetical protein HanLR1_Chr03g0095561 [Helianthus annuus]
MLIFSSAYLFSLSVLIKIEIEIEIGSHMFLRWMPFLVSGLAGGRPFMVDLSVPV